MYKRQWAATHENGGNRWARSRWQAQKWLQWGREQQFRQLTTSVDGKRLRSSTIMEAFGRQRVAQAGEPALFTVPPPPWLVKQAPPGTAKPCVPKTQLAVTPSLKSHPIHQRDRRRRRKRRRPGGAAPVAAGAARTGAAEVGLLESAIRVSDDAERRVGSLARKEDRSNAKGIG